MVVATAVEMWSTGSGPTGWRRYEMPARKITAWSTAADLDASMQGFTFLNERTARGEWTVLREGGPFHVRGQLPAYLERPRATGRAEWAERPEDHHGRRKLGQETR